MQEHRLRGGGILSLAISAHFELQQSCDPKRCPPDQCATWKPSRNLALHITQLVPPATGSQETIWYNSIDLSTLPDHQSLNSLITMSSVAVDSSMLYIFLCERDVTHFFAFLAAGALVAVDAARFFLLNKGMQQSLATNSATYSAISTAFDSDEKISLRCASMSATLILVPSGAAKFIRPSLAMSSWAMRVTTAIQGFLSKCHSVPRHSRRVEPRFLCVGEDS